MVWVLVTTEASIALPHLWRVCVISLIINTISSMAIENILNWHELRLPSSRPLTPFNGLANSYRSTNPIWSKHNSRFPIARKSKLKL